MKGNDALGGSTTVDNIYGQSRLGDSKSSSYPQTGLYGSSLDKPSLTPSTTTSTYPHSSSYGVYRGNTTTGSGYQPAQATNTANYNTASSYSSLQQTTSSSLPSSIGYSGYPSTSLNPPSTPSIFNVGGLLYQTSTTINIHNPHQLLYS